MEAGAMRQSNRLVSPQPGVLLLYPGRVVVTHKEKRL